MGRTSLSQYSALELLEELQKRGYLVAHDVHKVKQRVRVTDRFRHLMRKHLGPTVLEEEMTSRSRSNFERFLFPTGILTCQNDREGGF